MVSRVFNQMIQDRIYILISCKADRLLTLLRNFIGCIKRAQYAVRDLSASPAGFFLS